MYFNRVIQINDGNPAELINLAADQLKVCDGA